MKKNSITSEKDVTLHVADLMATASKTAPKACGADKIVSLILTGDDKEQLAHEMEKIGKETEQTFFVRDANNLRESHCIILIGVQDIPLALPSCGYCGFENCGLCKKAGSHCAFNVTDLGIAVGSAVSIAADHRIDNRVMYSAGKSAISLGLLGEDVRICYGIPLSTSSKSLFFDRDPGSVLV